MYVPGISAEENDSVAWFTAVMGEKLTENAHKGGWLNDDPLALLHHLDEEVEELVDALTTLKMKLGASIRTASDPATAADVDAVVYEAADVANMAMMVADVVSRSGFDNRGNGETGRC